jgi:hypothetical protein
LLISHSERKWKEKVKEWGFEKNIPSCDMSYMVAKSVKRKAEGKDTTFYRNGMQVDENKIEQFKKRRMAASNDVSLKELPGDSCDPYPRFLVDALTV